MLATALLLAFPLVTNAFPDSDTYDNPQSKCPGHAVIDEYEDIRDRCRVLYAERPRCNLTRFGISKVKKDGNSVIELIKLCIKYRARLHKDFIFARLLNLPFLQVDFINQISMKIKFNTVCNTCLQICLKICSK